MTFKKIRVAILDDHRSIVDGYLYRLGFFTNIEVVVTVSFGEDLEPALKKTPADVLLLDVNVPTSPDNANSYPILHVIPHLLEIYPEMSILVISMHNERGLIRTVMEECGASGYILKDDQETIMDLGNVIATVYEGGIHLSPQARQAMQRGGIEELEGPLQKRQLQAISICAAYPQASTAELARRMNIAHPTLRNLLSGTYLRLGVHTRAAAIAKAHQLGLLAPDTITLPGTKKREE